MNDNYHLYVLTECGTKRQGWINDVSLEKGDELNERAEINTLSEKSESKNRKFENLKYR